MVHSLDGDNSEARMHKLAGERPARQTSPQKGRESSEAKEFIKDASTCLREKSKQKLLMLLESRTWLLKRVWWCLRLVTGREGTGRQEATGIFDLGGLLCENSSSYTLTTFESIKLSIFIWRNLPINVQMRV
jgi:hypothetical protein